MTSFVSLVLLNKKKRELDLFIFSSHCYAVADIDGPLLSEVMCPRLTWLHPSHKLPGGGLNALIGVCAIHAKDMCSCSVPPLPSHPHHSSCLLSSRATTAEQQRIFFSRLQGWHSKLVNTSLQLRGITGAGTNC